MSHHSQSDHRIRHAANAVATPSGVSGKVVVVAFLTLLIAATVVVYIVVIQLKRGGTEALRENKERRVPAAAEAVRSPPAPNAAPAAAP